MDPTSSIVGGVSGIVTGIFVALGFKSRIDRLEEQSVLKETCAAMHQGWSAELRAIQSDLTHQLDAMRKAAEAAAEASEAAKAAAERATELSRAYILARDQESKDRWDAIGTRIDKIETLISRLPGRK